MRLLISALFLTMLEIGGAVGNAISGAIWTSTVPRKLKEYLPEESRHLAKSIYGNPFLAKECPRGSAVRDAVNRSFQETMSLLLWVALGFAAVTLILSLCLKDVRLDEVDQTERPGTGENEPSPTEDGQEPFVRHRILRSNDSHEAS